MGQVDQVAVVAAAEVVPLQDALNLLNGGIEKSSVNLAAFGKTDLRGKDYDDPMWDDLLNQMNVAEMAEMIGYGGYQTIAVKSIDKVATIDSDADQH